MSGIPILKATNPNRRKVILRLRLCLCKGTNPQQREEGKGWMTIVRMRKFIMARMNLRKTLKSYVNDPKRKDRGTGIMDLHIRNVLSQTGVGLG
jgi:hypothetical protein